MSPAPKPTTYKQYRKFEVLLDDLRKWIVSPEEDRRDQMAYCADQVGKFTQTLVYNPSQVSQIIDTINLLRASAGPGVVITEEELMRCLSDLMFLCVNVLLQKRQCATDVVSRLFILERLLCQLEDIRDFQNSAGFAEHGERLNTAFPAEGIAWTID